MTDVAELQAGDNVTIDTDDFSDDVWGVSSTEQINTAFIDIPIATIVNNGETYSLIGNLSHGEGKTVEVRTLDDEVLMNIYPASIELL